MSISFRLHWTGHPLIDMGIAAVTLATESLAPDDVTLEQWRDFMQRLEHNYVNGLFKKPSSILFTLNGFDNPGKGYTAQKRRQDIGNVFAKTRLETAPLDTHCAYFPEYPAMLRAARNRIPMIQGEGQINFYPLGETGIPLSGIALGCLLALPVVSPIVSGRFMIVAMDDVNLFLNLCYNWFAELQREYTIENVANGTLQERKAGRTRLLDEMDRLLTPEGQKLRHREDFSGYVTTTLYHISNSGNGPGLAIYTIPPLVSYFIVRANSGQYRMAWEALKRAFWRSPKGKLEGSEPQRVERLVSKNDLYELLNTLPDNALSFIQNYILKYVSYRVGLFTTIQVANLDMWPLLEIFLQEVLFMDRNRIEKIRTLADELASEIHDNQDKQLFRRLMGLESNARSYSALRTLLIKAAREKVKRCQHLLFTLDDYLTIFEQAEEYPHADWRYARDLIRVRCLETLHSKNYFGENSELLQDLTEDEEEDVTVDDL